MSISRALAFRYDGSSRAPAIASSIVVGIGDVAIHVGEGQLHRLDLQVQAVRRVRRVRRRDRCARGCPARSARRVPGRWADLVNPDSLDTAERRARPTRADALPGRRVVSPAPFANAAIVSARRAAIERLAARAAISSSVVGLIGEAESFTRRAARGRSAETPRRTRAAPRGAATCACHCRAMIGDTRNPSRAYSTAGSTRSWNGSLPKRADKRDPRRHRAGHGHGVPAFRRHRAAAREAIRATTTRVSVRTRSVRAAPCRPRRARRRRSRCRSSPARRRSARWPRPRAASTALPPLSSIRRPACAASGCEVATTLRASSGLRRDG